MKAIVIVSLLTLAACGAKGPLKWPEGEPPPAPLGAEAPLTAEQMLEPPPQAAPERVGNSVQRSESGDEDDEFDLPPPGG